MERRKLQKMIWDDRDGPPSAKKKKADNSDEFDAAAADMKPKVGPRLQ